jgi:UDP-N-acetylglucosamine--N-acetylmuramyl-(pentapeptide) pyrophosphoryl-undecaprenol N-acetylglucosamine transferase
VYGDGQAWQAGHYRSEEQRGGHTKTNDQSLWGLVRIAKERTAGPRYCNRPAMTTLLVASTGGHLKQLHRLHRRLTGVEGPFRWATFDTPQSRSLLEGETVEFVRFVGGRDPLNLLSNTPAAHRMMRDRELRTIVSTGSSMALPFFVLARARRLRCHYIESAARSDGPSVTGRLMSLIPGVFLYSQYPGWAAGRWNYRGSVFDSFVAESPGEQAQEELERVVVSLGTFRGYGFVRLVRRLLEVLPPHAEVLWQTGDTDTSGLGIDGHHAIPERDLIHAMREADVVVAHAGVGTALAALEAGKCPVLVPRRLAHGEHVDDHQTQIALELARRGLSVSVEADALTRDDLLAAAGRAVTTLSEEPPFRACTP